MKIKIEECNNGFIVFYQGTNGNDGSKVFPYKNDLMMLEEIGRLVHRQKVYVKEAGQA